MLNEFQEQGQELVEVKIEGEEQLKESQQNKVVSNVRLSLEKIHPIPNFKQDSSRGSSRSKNSLEMSSEASVSSVTKNAKKELISVLLDIPIIVFAIVFVILGIILGVILFVLLVSGETTQVTTDLEKESTQLFQNFNSGIQALYTQMNTLQAFLMETPDPRQVTFDKFKRFVDKSGILGVNILNFQFLQKISDTERSSFGTELQTIYSSTAFPSAYSVYDVRLANGTKVITQRENYYPVKLVVPLDGSGASNIGFAVDSDLVRKDGLQTSLATQGIAATALSVLRRNGTINAFFITTPVYNISDASQVFGLVRAIVKADSVLDNLLQSKDAEVNVYDARSNQTIIESKHYSTSSQKYEMVLYTEMGTRPWRITVRASNLLINHTADANYGKWIALFLPIGVAVLVAAFIIAFLIIKRMHFQKTQQKHLADKVSILQTNTENLEVLMERIANGEQLSRTILHAIPMPIFTMDNDGVIQHTNPSFEEEFIMDYSTQSLHITKVFPVFEQLQQFEDWLQNPSNQDFALALTNKFNQSKQFRLIHSKQSVVLHKDVNKKKVRQELSVIVLQYMDMGDMKKPSERKSNIVHMGSEIVDRSMIKQILNDVNLLKEFKEFCAREQNEENVMFLEEVKEYRHMKKVTKRVEKQEAIKQKYLIQNASHALNLPQQILENQMSKLYSGRIDDFDEIEVLVMNMLSQDSLHRFLFTKQHPSDHHIVKNIDL